MNKIKKPSKQSIGNNAKEVVIKFIDGPSELLFEYSTSSLFKVYLKSLLMNKAFTLETLYQLTFLNKSISYKIIKWESSSMSSSSPQEKEAKDFNVTLSTQISFDLSSYQIDSLTAEFNSKLSIDPSPNELTEDNKTLLREIINRRLSLNKGLVGENNYFNSLIPVNNEKEYEKIMNMITLQFERSKPNDILINKDNYLNYSYKGIILSGSSGIGKTHLISCIKKGLKEKNINHFDIDIFKELTDKDKGANLIHLVFKFARILSPSVIIVESIDSLFPKSDDDSTSPSSSSASSVLDANPALSAFINDLDLMQSNCFVISSCVNLSRINSEIVKHNRLDYSIQLVLPTYSQRKSLIEFYSKDFKNNLSNEDIETLADKSHGFVPGDIIKLFKESYLSALISNKEQITLQLIQENLSNIKPINLKDIIIDIPKVLWSEIGGNKAIIKTIRQSIEWPLKNPEAFKRLGISPPNGTLLYGPPGCSKTMIAKALATESGLNFFAVKGPELFSKYVGDTEKAVRDIFKKAKQSSPSIIFFDEIDSMASQRGHDSGVEDKVLCQLLNEMDGIEGREKVVIFGATNRPDILDKALIRPGRFDRLIYIQPPDDVSREEIFKICLSTMEIAEDVDIKELVAMTSMFSGADITKVCREAGMLALSDDINAESISKNNLISSIKQTKPIITHEMLLYFEAFSKSKE